MANQTTLPSPDLVNVSVSMPSLQQLTPTLPSVTSPPTGRKSSDGLIRMLLQSATPTQPSSPNAAANSSPTTPLLPSSPLPIASGSPNLSANQTTTTKPPAGLLSPSQQETEDEKAKSYIYRITGNVITLIK